MEEIEIFIEISSEGVNVRSAIVGAFVDPFLAEEDQVGMDDGNDHQDHIVECAVGVNVFQTLLGKVSLLKNSNFLDLKHDKHQCEDRNQDVEI